MGFSARLDRLLDTAGEELARENVGEGVGSSLIVSVLDWEMSFVEVLNRSSARFWIFWVNLDGGKSDTRGKRMATKQAHTD